MPGHHHVLIIVENLPVPFDRRVWLEANALKGAGYEVTVICPTGPSHEPGKEVIDGITVHRHPLREARGGALGYLKEYASALAWETRLAWQVWRSRRFHVVHVCNPPDLLFLVALPFKLLGARVVFDHHDLGPELFVEKFGRRGPIYWLMRAAERLTFAVADHVISTNESYAAIARRRGRKRPEQVTVVRSGPLLDTFRRVEAARVPGRVTLGYVGVMAKQDGVDILLRAVAHLVHDMGRADVRLVLVGDGPSREELEALAKELRIEGAVDFLGYRTGDELLRAMSTFDIGVVPDPKSEYNDKCTMNKVLEYMALGIPLVQFDLDEGRRSAGDAAVYAGTDNDPRHLAAAIVELADDPERRARLGETGRRRMEEELEWRHQAPQLLEAYREVTR